MEYYEGTIYFDNDGKVVKHEIKRLDKKTEAEITFKTTLGKLHVDSLVALGALVCLAVFSNDYFVEEDMFLYASYASIIVSTFASSQVIGDVIKIIRAIAKKIELSSEQTNSCIRDLTEKIEKLEAQLKEKEGRVK